MRRDLANRLLLGAVAVLVVAALLDGVIGGDGSGAPGEEASPDPVVRGSPADTPSDVPDCVQAQLDLLIEVLGGAPVITLGHVRGPECRTGTLELSLEVVDRRGRVVLRGDEASELVSELPPQRMEQDSYVTLDPPAFQTFDWCAPRGPFLIFASLGGYADRLQVPCVR